uniref:haloacid dehalogenase-like hydrolase domain-containing protein At2g33255 n=1 Tax=Erigeron canadensis TaxID=72917 RepID=UPI001CB8D9F2|nr:haloacid dehalogenase-like hydrolase domain-containing protein At2g33255 [Erigeron canadensis]
MPPLNLPQLKIQTHNHHFMLKKPYLLTKTLFKSMSFNQPTSTMKPVPRLKGVVFDMDGTLTVPVIDFQAMYKAVLGDQQYLAIKSSSPSGIDILHHIEQWAPDQQLKAYQIIADFEKQGMDKLQIMPGAAELCGFLNSRNIRRGLITRNVKLAVDLFHERFGMSFSPALSREFRPYKPDPAPLLHICTTWEVEPNEVMMIGDSLKDDVACGKRAGAFTCLLDETGRYDSPQYANVEHKPDYKVSSLAQVLSLLESNFDLTP